MTIWLFGAEMVIYLIWYHVPPFPIVLCFIQRLFGCSVRYFEKFSATGLCQVRYSLRPCFFIIEMYQLYRQQPGIILRAKGSYFLWTTNNYQAASLYCHPFFTASDRAVKIVLEIVDLISKCQSEDEELQQDHKVNRKLSRKM